VQRYYWRRFDGFEALFGFLLLRLEIGHSHLHGIAGMALADGIYDALYLKRQL